MTTARNPRPPTSRTRKSDVLPERPVKLEPHRPSVLTGIVCGLFLLWCLTYHGPSESRKLYADLFEFAVASGAGLWSLWGVWTTRFDRANFRRGLAANLLSLSVVAYAGGMALYDYFDLVLHQTPFPSWADAAYIAGTVIMMAAILVLPSRPVPWVVRLRVLIDGLMVAAALVTFSWYFNLGPTILAGSETLLGRILGPAYPLADIVMMVCLLTRSGAVDDPAAKRVRKLVALGVVSYVVADSLYAYETLKGTYEIGRWYDLGWVITNLVVAQAAVAERRRSSKAADHEESETVHAFGARPASIYRMLLPYAFVPGVTALVVYVYHSSAKGALAAGVYIGATVLLALILVRQVLAIAENSRLYRYLQKAYLELEALATTDAMTGLWNHRMFQERLRNELAAHNASGGCLTLLLIDVDRFKAFNDQFGHPAGDGALRKVAEVIRGCVRSTDMPARYGGEEFAVILPSTTSEEAMAVAERIRQICEETAFHHRQVTLSIGVSEHRGGTAGELIEAADRALYAAKHSGRNQTVSERSSNMLRLVHGGETSGPDTSSADAA